MSDDESLFGPEDVIDTYSRAQAIEDGFLVDVTTIAKEAGLSLPTVVTRHVWNDCIEVPKGLEGQQDEQGRLWDVVYMASMALRAAVRAGKSGDRLDFDLLVRDKPEPAPLPLVRLVAVVGPGDQAEPVLTLMFPEDD